MLKKPAARFDRMKVVTYGSEAFMSHSRAPIMHALRKKIWIDRFQTNLSLRLAMYFLMYMIAVLTWASIDRVTRDLLESHFGQASTLWSIMSSSVLVAVGFLFIYDMMRFSHRFVGPLF